MHQCTRRVTPRRIEAALAELRGDEADAAGGGKEEARRDGLIAAADFAVYLREFGSICSRAALLIATAASAASSVTAAPPPFPTCSPMPPQAATPSSPACNCMHQVAANLFLAHWTDPSAAAAEQTDEAERRSLGIYLLLGCGTEVFAAVQTLLLTLCSLRASRVLHAQLLRRLLHAPMAFFDSMSSGAILNRFLSDTMNVDSRVPDSLTSLGTQLLTMVTQLGLVLRFAPWVAMAMPFLGLAYYRIYKRMRAAARDARRINAALHSPVFAHFSDVLAGRETIASYGAEARMCQQNEAHVAAMSRSAIMSQAVQKWAQSLTVQTGSVLYLAAGVVCVVLQAWTWTWTCACACTCTCTCTCTPCASCCRRAASSLPRPSG